MPADTGSLNIINKMFGSGLEEGVGKDTNSFKRHFYDLVFVVGFLCCLIPGPLPSLVTPASILLLVCVVVSFFDENFYLYTGLFVFARYTMMVGETPAFRFYSYLIVLKFVLRLFKIEFKVSCFSAIFVFLMHCVFAAPKYADFRLSMNVIVDCAIIYLVIVQVSKNETLLRKFIYALLFGAVSSGIYGWTASEVVVEVNIRGAGANTVSRNFGSLFDANIAGLFYTLSLLSVIVVKNIPKLLRIAMIAIFLMMIMQTVSLSAMITLILMLALLVILKFRGKSVFILFFGLIAAILIISILLTIPQFRAIKEVADLIIRIEEKFGYFIRGRWDLLTTDRTDIWEKTLPYFINGSIWTKLIGGNVITVYILDETKNFTACHNSYIQSIMNFGIIGTILIYLPFIASLFYKIYKHFHADSGYEGEDVRIITILFGFLFLVFGMSVDFFIDWPFMMLLFI